MKLYALLTVDGTPCPETTLAESEFTPRNRARMEAWVSAQPLTIDSPVPDTWAEVTNTNSFEEA